MGNSNCDAELPSQDHKDLKVEDYDTNTTFEDDYSSQTKLKHKNAKTEQSIKIKTLGILKGSKQLQFGFENIAKPTSSKSSNRSIGLSEQTQEKNSSKPHLEPIVFSIIDFSVISDRSETGSSINGRRMCEDSLKNILNSTRQEQEGIEVGNQKAVLDYLLDFVDTSPHVEVDKQQFIRVKKSNIENDYEFNQKMGEGAFGVVFKCTHKQSRQFRAVKLLKRSMLINPKVKQQFLQEFSILKKVDHPHVLKLYEIYETKNSISIVSEFCEGNSLASYIKKKIVFTSETKMEILRQLFLGVNYLHHMNITHRDLKPENIVFVNIMSEASLPSEVDLRIIDFGLAAQQNQLIFKDWARIGTYNFMAPEVFQGTYSNKCDSWACGIIMYVLLLNFNPFKGYQANDVKEKIHKYTPDINDFKTISVQATQLILHLTKLNHIIRWSMRQALQSKYFTQTQSQDHKDEIKERLSKYRAVRGLASVSQSYLLFKKMSQTQKAKFGKYFNSINSRKNGTINMKELQDYLKDVKTEQIKDYFQSIDKNRSGAIDFGQFLVAMSNKRQIFTEQNLREVFEVIDVNKKGKVTKQEIKYFLRSYDKTAVGNLVSEISQSNNTFITFQEFSSYLRKDKWF